MSTRFLVLLLVLVTGLGIGLSAWENDFPLDDHWDEPSKVAQVQVGWRNYNHPPLMLNLGYLVSRAQGRDLDRQAVARSGRLLSAVCVGIAIGTLCLLAYRLANLAGAAAAAVALLTDPWLLDAGHYFKEDAILLCGLALALLAMTLYQERPMVRRMVLLALTCSVAAAAKLVGLVVIPFALVVVGARPPTGFSRSRAVALVLGVALVGFCLLCLHPALWRAPAQVLDAQQREWTYLLEGRSPGQTLPNFGFLCMAAETLAMATWIFYCAFAAWTWRTCPKERAPYVPALAFPLYFLVLISLQRLAYTRYFLPARMLFLVGAALGFVACLTWIHRVPARWIRWALVLLCLGLAGQQLHAQISRGRAFGEGRRYTTRSELRAWVRDSLDPSAVIAQDFSARIRDVPQRVIDTGRLSELGDLAALLAQGVTHVAIDRSWYQEHLSGSGAGDRFLEDAALCKDLATRATVRVSLPSRDPGALNPQLILLELD